MGHPWDRDDPLKRVEPETERSNAALRQYALLGPKRCIERLGIRRATVGEWSARFDWQARVAAWDLRQWEQQLDEITRERREERRKRQLRRTATSNLAITAARRLQAIIDAADDISGPAALGNLVNVASLLSNLERDELADARAEDEEFDRALARRDRLMEATKPDAGRDDADDHFEERLRFVERQSRAELGPS